MSTMEAHNSGPTQLTQSPAPLEGKLIPGDQKPLPMSHDTVAQASHPPTPAKPGPGLPKGLEITFQGPRTKPRPLFGQGQNLRYTAISLESHFVSWADSTWHFAEINIQSPEQFFWTLVLNRIITHILVGARNCLGVKS